MEDDIFSWFSLAIPAQDMKKPDSSKSSHDLPFL
jgi:hypothetical protein